jgi:mannose-1-phosphate guanylyltransferase
MKAIILAAGKGLRLRPLTEKKPKCLLPIQDKPLLEYWMDNLANNNFDEVIINGHYLAEQVENYINKVQKKYPFKITYVYEEILLGTGGTIKRNYDLIKNEDFFLLCHGDNFTNIDISKFINFHKTKKTDLSVALFRTNVPKQCGIVNEIDHNNLILSFKEKPKEPKSNIASAAIFLLSPKVVNNIKCDDIFDFSKEILPEYQGKMYGYFIDGFNIDIGTLHNYNYANKVAFLNFQIKV